MINVFTIFTIFIISTRNSWKSCMRLLIVRYANRETHRPLGYGKVNTWLGSVHKREPIAFLVTLARVPFQIFVLAYTIFSVAKRKSCCMPKPPKSWKPWKSWNSILICAKTKARLEILSKDNWGPLASSRTMLTTRYDTRPRVTIPRHRFGKIKDVLHDFHDFQNRVRKSWKSCNENRENRKTDKRVPEGWYWCNTLPIFIVHGCRGL